MKQSKKGLINEVDGHLYYKDYCIDELPIFKVMVDYKIKGKKWIMLSRSWNWTQGQ